ncbi:endonuclease NucS domain-containing protein [Arthrobacter mobilis]|uniref:DUF91 domain-containing protein n=1 Tax=Arthrobacter mobilis TaxID=2724944 RepID=A0A7X6HDU2_9MICC|nr:endonuclease NucS domain-containing protein [Arthrobacter mobilis]NKX55294.1 DUF91 domain-containing protein [Arthrobacter mobilis]
MRQILIRQADGTWREPADAGYALEADLQELLAAHPDLIPGVGPQAAVCREFQSAAGPADIVIVDADGEVTLVECKLAANPQVRREIVGQMFDYAARLWRMDVEEFDARWRARTGDSLFTDHSGNPLFRDTVARNLAEARFRIVLAVDAINEPLKRMVEYLNAMSGPGTSVIAVEYARRALGPVEVLLPEVYGQELAEAKSVAEDDRKVWDAPTYRAWLETNEPALVGKFDAFIAEAAARDRVFVGSPRATSPSGGLPVRDARGRQLGTVSLFHFSVQGTSIEFSFIRMSRMPEEELPDQELLERFLHDLGNIPGLAEVAANLRSSRFASRKPNIPLSALTEDALRQAVAAVAVLAERP